MALTSLERDPGTFRSASPAARLILLIFLSISLMVLDHRDQHLVSARKALAVVLYPLQVLVSAPFSFSRDIAETMASRSEILADNERLQQEALVLNARMQRMTALEAENARLRALLDSTAKVGDSILIAEIVSVDMNPFRNMIVVNKGGKDGAYVGQALIDADGIVGQITRDRHFSAEAMLVTDIDHAIPVEIARNRLRTIAVGSGELDRLSLPYLPVSADIRDGDLLISSGLGGIFPPGYPVGVVRAIRSVTGQPFLEVNAEPAAALNRIREVLLITPQRTNEADALDNELETGVPAATAADGTEFAATSVTEANPDTAEINADTSSPDVFDPTETAADPGDGGLADEPVEATR
jgi:rod shape-determining protein MreC